MADLALPLVSVIVPVYNKASTVARTIASIKNQTFGNIEAILVDDGSTDNPRQIILDAFQGDRRFQYFYQANRGVAHARNAGIAQASGLFVVCLDADDEIRPTFVEVCVRALLADNSLAIAYSRMEVVAADGTRTLSDWPGQYSFGDFLRRRNPVPTCALFRRTFWDRVGGYRQRYAPGGAGAEDVEFWMRVGAAGGRGELVSQEPLFIYHLGGAVSGNPDYREVEWRAGKPWVDDGLHPFASLAAPANGSAHLVRQVDEPTVTIVIPCGPDHMRYLWDALDSVEAQTYRRWECVVVYDGDSVQGASTHAEWWRLGAAFPSMRFTVTPKARSGAGAARNIGASLARAPLLLYLDADDWLEPNALALLLDAYAANPGSIIYADYVGYALIDNAKEIESLRRAKRLLAHDSISKQTVMRYYSAEYECERAIAQPDPDGNFYIWNVVSSLVPKQYHLEIGGFDAAMDSWEDWDYWIRLARAGKCFVRVDKPLLNYRFHTGQRRMAANPGESGDFGRQLSTKLLTYMLDKYKRSDVMPCSGCGGKRSAPPLPMMRAATLNEGRMVSMSADNMVTVQLNDGNVGEHLIVFNQVSYGYRAHGDTFKMQRAHALLDRRVVILDNQPSMVVAAQPPTPLATPAPLEPYALPRVNLPDPVPATQGVAPGLVTATESVFAPPLPEAPPKQEKEIVLTPKVYNFAALWGINDDKAEILVKNGIRSLDGLQLLGPGRLAKMLDVPDTVAKNILARVEKMQDK